MPFETAPIPSRPDLAATSPRAANSPAGRPADHRLSRRCAGRSYQHLPQALAYLWKDYVSPGRVRFVLQSNFNTPGGEAGILAASQNLAGFLGTTLKNEPLQPPEYYEILANADIMLIPTRRALPLPQFGSAGRGHGRRQGRRDQRESWMATQVASGPRGAVRDPGGTGPAIAEAIDRFDALSAGARTRREAAGACHRGKPGAPPARGHRTRDRGTANCAETRPADHERRCDGVEERRLAGGAGAAALPDRGRPSSSDCS